MKSTFSKKCKFLCHGWFFGEKLRTSRNSAGLREIQNCKVNSISTFYILFTYIYYLHTLHKFDKFKTLNGPFTKKIM